MNEINHCACLSSMKTLSVSGALYKTKQEVPSTRKIFGVYLKCS